MGNAGMAQDPRYVENVNRVEHQQELDGLIGAWTGSMPQAEVLGVTLPDPDLKWNEARGHWDYGQIDWDEFWAVVNGDGPCNKERLATRVKAWNDGQWVRDAALAHARKQEERAMKEAA